MNVKKIILIVLLCVGTNLVHAGQSVEGYIKYLNQWSDGKVGLQMASDSVTGAQC